MSDFHSPPSSAEELASRVSRTVRGILDYWERSGFLVPVFPAPQVALFSPATEEVLSLVPRGMEALSRAQALTLEGCLQALVEQCYAKYYAETCGVRSDPFTLDEAIATRVAAVVGQAQAIGADGAQVGAYLAMVVGRMETEIEGRRYRRGW